MPARYLTPFIAICLIGTLSGCGGGGGGGGASSGTEFTTGWADLPATDTASVAAVTLRASDPQSARQTGEIDFATSTFVLNGETGTVSGDRSTLTLDSGALLDVAVVPDRFALRFDRLDPNGPPVFGVIGIATDPSAMPLQGSALYRGQSELLVQTQTDVFELTGDSALSVDFARRSGTQVRIANLAGTRFPNFGAREDLSLVGEIRIDDIQRDGAVLSGGDADLIGTAFPVSFQSTFTLNGQFYGPDADEVGATFVIDDRGTNAILIMGDILVKK